MIERKIFILQCPKCGWRAYRDRHEGLRICSKCGHEGQPVIWDAILEIKENPYLQKDFECAKEYAEKLLDGEPLEELMARLYECKDQSFAAHLSRAVSMIEAMFSDVCVGQWCAKALTHARNKETY